MITRYEVQNWLRLGLRQTPLTNSLAALARRNVTSLTENQKERLAFLGNVGALKVHEGELQPDKPIEVDYYIKNEKFSRGIALPGSWLRNDKTGEVRSRVNQLSTRYIQWPGKLVGDLVNAGSTALCFDGKPFFATDHVYGKSGAWSNALQYNVGTPASPTADEVSKAVNYALAQMVGFVDDQAEPMNEDMSAVTILCHHSWQDVFLAALESPTLDTGAGNARRSGARLGGLHHRREDVETGSDVLGELGCGDNVPDTKRCRHHYNLLGCGLRDDAEVGARITPCGIVV